MAKSPAISPVNPPDVPVPEQSPGAVAEQEPPAGAGAERSDFDTAFDAAVSQLYTPSARSPEQAKAFDQGFNVAAQNLLTQAAQPENVAGTLTPEEVPWWQQAIEAITPAGPIQEVRRIWQSQFGQSLDRAAEQTAAQIEQGVELGVGRTLAPSTKYGDQSISQILDGIGKAQDEVNRLSADLNDNPNEFRYDMNAPRIAALQSDIVGMRRALEAKGGGTPSPPSPLESAGQALVARGDETQHQLDILAGRVPPDTPQTWLERMDRLLAPAPPNPLFEPSQAGTVARLAGQTAVFGALAPTGPVGETAAFAGAQYAGAEEEGRAAGAPIAQRHEAGTLAAALAPAQTLAFRTVLAPFLEGNIGRTVGEVLKNTARNVTIGAGLGGAQTLWDNAVAALSGIDPTRKLTAGLAESVGQQAATMGILGLATEVPSFALRSLSTPRIDVYGPEPAARAAAPAEEPVVQPETPTPEAALAALERGIAEPPAARMDIGGGPVYGTNTPVDERGIRSMLSDLVDQVGERANFLVADEGTLPLRYRSALARAGQSPESYRAFFDRDTQDFVVNPKNFATERELADAIIRNFLPNTFGDKASIVPLDSWTQAAETPAVSRLLFRNPSADTNTGAIYDPESGNVFLNVPKHLDGPEPVAEAIRSVVHEIAGHQGLRSLYGENYPGYDSFLERVYNGMRAEGMGDAIAAQFGTNMDGLAERYGFGTRNPDGTVSIAPRGRQRLAEELLARYAERYDPHALEALPGVLSRAIDLVRTGLDRFQGLQFSDHDAFRAIRDAWRDAEPPRDPSAQNALLAKQITKSHEPNELQFRRASSPGTTELSNTAKLSAPLRAQLPPSGGFASTDEAIRASSERLGLVPKPAGYEYSPSRLSQRAPYRISGTAGDEHDVRFPVDPEHNRYVLNVTRSDSASGPYGPAPAWPARPGIGAPEQRAIAGEARSYDANRATAQQYLERLGLSNEFFGSQHELEGYLRDPDSGLWRIVSSQPQIEGEFRPATVSEIASFMAARGFHPIDDRTYYNPEARVLVLQAEPGNVVIQGDNGQVHAVNVAPFHVEGELASHLETVVRDPNRLAGLENAQGVLEALGAHGAGEPTPEALASAERLQKADQAELSVLREKSQAGTLTPAEAQRMDQIEYGPLLKRDLDAELGAGSPNEPPIEILKRAIEDMRRSRTLETGERVHAARTAADPNEPDPVRAFNAAEDQLQYEKGSRQIWREVADNVLDRYGGNIAEIANHLTSDGFSQEGHREWEAAIYRALKTEVATRRVAAVAENNQLQVERLDAWRNQLDGWANLRRTSWGKEGAAWQDVLFSGPGVIDSDRAGYYSALERRVRGDKAFRDAVQQIKDIVKSVNREIPTDPQVERTLEVAQKAQDRAKEAQDWALTMARSLVDQATGALEPARVLPGVEEMLKRFRREIAAQMREGDIKMDPNTMAKVRASKTIGDLVRAWPYLSRVQELVRTEGIRQFANDPEMLERFRNLPASTEMPFSKAHLAAFAREQGVDIRQLFTQHREQIGRTIESLSDFLIRQTDLDPERARLIEQAVGGFINRAVGERRAAEFQRIIDRANNGKPKEEGRGTTMQRLLNLVNIGAFRDEEVANALAPVYGFKGYDPALDVELRQVADNLEAFRQAGRDGFQTEALRMKLNRSLSNYAQVRFWEYWGNIFRGNILATIPGHIGGFINENIAGVGNLFDRLLRVHRFDPRAIADTFTELARGFGQALPEVRYMMRTGQYPAGFQSVEELRADTEARTRRYPGGYFETKPTRRALESLLKPLRLQAFAPVGKWLVDQPYVYSHRAISALHNVIYSAYGRATKFLAASEHARLVEGLSPSKALDWAEQSLNPSRGAVEAFRQQALGEGLSGTEAKMRVQELVDQQLPSEILDEADYWGTRANAQQDPHGILGAVGDMATRLTREYPELTQFLPIIRLPLNLLNTGIDLTPFGFWRFLQSEQYLTRGGKLQLGPTEELHQARLDQLKGHLLAKAITGTGLLTAGLIYSSIRRPDGSFPITVYGAGPQKQDEKYQFLDEGHQPYSIAFGRLNIPYEWMPFSFGLAMIGNWQDAQRYQGMPPGLDAASYMLGRSMGYFLDRSFLRGMSDLVENLKQVSEHPDRPAPLERYMAGTAKNFIPTIGMNIWKQAYQQFLDDKLYRAKGMAAITRDIPFVASASGLKPVLNALGEPVSHLPSTRFWSETSDDKVWEFLDKNQIWLSKGELRSLGGEPPTEDQKYDFAAFRGQHLRVLLASQLSQLSAFTDPDLMDERIKGIERQASKLAKRDLLMGKKPTFEH